MVCLFLNQSLQELSPYWWTNQRLTGYQVENIPGCLWNLALLTCEWISWFVTELAAFHTSPCWSNPFSKCSPSRHVWEESFQPPNHRLDLEDIENLFRFSILTVSLGLEHGGPGQSFPVRYSRCVDLDTIGVPSGPMLTLFPQMHTGRNCNGLVYTIWLPPSPWMETTTSHMMRSCSVVIMGFLPTEILELRHGRLFRVALHLEPRGGVRFKQPFWRRVWL